MPRTSNNSRFSLFDWFKPIQPTRPKIPRERLMKRTGFTTNQARTIEALTGTSKAAQYRSELWERYREGKFPSVPEEPPPAPPEQPPPTRVIRAPGRLRLSLTPEARAFVKDLLDHNFVQLKIVDKPGHETPVIVAMTADGQNIREIGDLILVRKPEREEEYLRFTPGVHMKMEDEHDGERLQMEYRLPLSRLKLQSAETINQGEIVRRAARGLEHGPALLSPGIGAALAVPDPSETLHTLLNRMLAGTGAKDFFQLGASAIDNVTYYDFADYLYVCNPEFAEQLPPQPEIPEDVVDTNQDLEDSGINAADNTAFYINLVAQFERRIRELYLTDRGEAMVTGQYTRFYQAGVIRVVDVLFLDADRLAHFETVYWSLQTQEQRRLYLQWIVAEFETIAPSAFSGAGGMLSFYFQLASYDPDSGAGWSGYFTDDAVSMHWLTVEGRLLEEWTDLSPYSEFGGAEAPVTLAPSNEINCVLPDTYAFDLYAPTSFNLGLRLVYRQEWRPLGDQRGELIKTIPLAPKQVERMSVKTVRRQKATQTSEQLKSTETTTETADTTKDTSEVVQESAKSFGWHAEATATATWGWGAAQVKAGAEGSSESRSQNTSTSLSESMRKSASKIRNESKIIVSTERETTFEVDRSSEIVNPNEEIPVTYVYSKLQRQYEVMSRLAEVQNVVLVAEPVPAPYEITDEWIKKHDWILAAALLDNSFRDTLTEISQDVIPPIGTDGSLADTLNAVMTQTVGHLGTVAGSSSNLSLSNVDVARESQSGYKQAVKDLIQAQRERRLRQYKRCRFREHIARNILHYSRAIWEQEDPQQRLLRYRRSGLNIPLQWRFQGRFGDIESEWDVNVLEDLIATHAVQQDNNFVLSLDGDFLGNLDDEQVRVADLIDPTGPLGYIGNYTVYAIRSEYDETDIHAMLQIAKAPYLYYTAAQNGEGVDTHLIDPTYKRYLREFSDRAPADEAEKLDMIDYVPALRLRYALTPEAERPDFIADPDGVIFPPHYPEYRYRLDMTRRFLVDTNNLIIDILPGTGTALETYKLAHRMIDVFKANEELAEQKLENLRKDARINKDQLSDPDIEQVTIVASEPADFAHTVLSSVAAATSSGGGDNPETRRRR